MAACDCGCGGLDGCLGCPPLIPEPPIPDCVVQFDYARWSLRYPEFGPDSARPVSEELAQEFFYDATIYLDNTCQSPVCDASKGGERERLLFLLTAHLAFLGGPGSSQQVGYMTNKSVGPVSVGYGGLQGLPQSAAFFTQSKYGFAFWQATAASRFMRYRRFPGFPGRLPVRLAVRY